MKKVSAEPIKVFFTYLQLRCRPVERVSHDRMAQGRKMHANLVRAAGVQLDFDQRRGVNAYKNAPVGPSFAGIAQDGAAAGGHSHAALGITSNRKFDPAALFFQQAFDESDVGFFDAALAERFAELCVCSVVLGDKDDARGVLVEAMHDPGTQDAAGLREGLPTPEQCVNEGAARISSAGMNDHACRLVHRYYVLVLVKDFERDRFGFHAYGRAWLDLDINAFAAVKPVRALCGATLQKNESSFDQFLNPGATEIGAMRSHHSIETLASFFGENNDLVLHVVNSARRRQFASPLETSGA
jgi:hypothetical protein